MPRPCHRLWKYFSDKAKLCTAEKPPPHPSKYRPPAYWFALFLYALADDMLTPPRTPPSPKRQQTRPTARTAGIAATPRHHPKGGSQSYGRAGPTQSGYEHGNDSVFHRAVEPDSLIAVLWHFSCFAN